MKPYKELKVYYWKTETDKQEYIFNTDDSKYPIIYSDDSINDALNKIAFSIKNDMKNFYCWKDNKSLLFTIEKIKWDGYNVNPYKSINRTNDNINDPINYNYSNDLFGDYKSINIIFDNTINDLKNNKYYFIKRNILGLEQYIKRDKKLKNLEEIDNKNINNISINLHRYELSYNFKKEIYLSEIFDILTTNENISMIQWVDDNYKILYKLHKFNKLNSELLNLWTSTEKIIKMRCINIYSIIANNCYSKITIDNNGIIIFSYIIDLRERISFDEINNHKNILIKYIENAVKQPIKLNETSIKLKILFNIDNTNLDNLSKKIGEYVDIFQLIKINKEKKNLLLIYKRTSNYNKQEIDFNKYAKLRLELGLSKKEIIDELINIGLTKDEAIKIINDLDIIEGIQLNKEEVLNRDDNTIIVIEPVKNGFSVNIYNIPNRNELNYLIYWLSKIISASRVSIVKKKVKSPIFSSSSSSSKSSSKSLSSKDDDEDLGKMDYAFEGGTITDKEKRGYFVNLLKQSDKDLFIGKYARECQASSNQQPISMTKEYKEKLEKEGNFHFDNVLEYGSKENIKNFYACPRLWCPKSKIPLNPDDKDAKCPNDDEEPMELFFNKDKNRKKYIQLINSKNREDNICIPCCFKSEPKEKDLKQCKYYKTEEEPIKKSSIKKEEKIEKDENYLMTQTAPITVGRYGVIPKSLHQLLRPNINFTLCSKILNKTEKCFVRKGINHKTEKKLKIVSNDSLIYAISHILNFKNKEDFIKDIKKRLDLITFLSLENGEICKSFTDRNPIIVEDNLSLINDMKKKIDKKLINTENKSRLLSIYNSYNKFIEYLESNDYPTNKSPYFLYSLLSILYKVILIIWEKNNDDVSILCPYYLSFEDILSSMEINPNLVMLLKEKKYYEPIELKLRSDDGEKLIQLNDYPNIKNLIKECSNIKKHFNNDNTYKYLYTLNQWINNSKILKNPKKFIINSVIINNDLSIDSFLTNGNILIKTNKISISFLKKILKELNISKILFYDDLINNKYNINVLRNDLELFATKIKELDINFNIGILKKGISIDDIEYYSVLQFDIIPLTNDTIHTRKIDELYEYDKKTTIESKRWYQLYIYIIKTILNKYNKNQLEILNSKNRVEIIKDLLKLFEKNPNKTKIQIILEELPLTNLKNYLDNIIFYYKYKFLDTNIQETKNEFIFSQIGLLKTNKEKLLLYHHSNPNTKFGNYLVNDYIIQKEFKNDIKLPDIYNGTFEKLKSKWVMHKKSKWSNMVYIKCDYNINTIKNFYLFFASYLGIKTNYNELKQVANIKLRELYLNQEGMFEILDDPSYFNAWNKKISKNFKTVKLFWDNYYSKIDNKEKLRIIDEIIDEDLLYPNDLYILSITDLLNINILTIHRGKYGKFEEGSVRGDIEDLLLSSTFFKASNNYQERPLIIFHKSYDYEKSIYNIIIDQKKSIEINNLYLHYKDVPTNIKYLVDAHLST